MKKPLILGGLLAVAMTATSATAATYIVDPAGGSGVFTTIRACAGVTQPGDTCSINSGTYHETLSPMTPGTYASPINFTAASGANVLVDGVSLDSAAFIWIQGLKFQSISQYGITWSFDNYYLSGLFANGDYWVQGPVTITSMAPAWNGAHNGWEVNPVAEKTQPYDAGGYGFNAGTTPSLPYLAQPGSSIVKGLSYVQDPANTASCYSTINTTCLLTAAVLTVVGSVPQDNGKTVFRPPYIGTNKVFYSVNNLQLSLLPSLAPVANTPALNDPIFLRMQRIQLDHFEGAPDRTARPKMNLPDYGGAIGNVNAAAALRLMLNDPIQAKMPLLIAYVQGGIDRYFAAASGQTWPGGGGYEVGEKISITFAGVMLNDPNMITLTRSGVRIGDEDGMTSITTNQGLPLWGDPTANTSFIESSYWDFQLHDPGYNDDGGDFYKFTDGGGNTVRIDSDYQVKIVSPVMIGSAIAAILLPNAKQDWNNQKFFNYVDRWVNVGVWTQPDPCAPVVGICEGGSNPGARCTTQTEIVTQTNGDFKITGNAACAGGGICVSTDAATYQSNFGVTYGPAGGGKCILDPNLTAGSTMQSFSCQSGKVCGRYPKRQGIYTDNWKSYGSLFFNEMWAAYRNASPPPTVAVTAPANGAAVSGTITVSGTAADTVAVANVQVSVDGGTYSAASGTTGWTFSLNTASLTNASHTISAKATDTSGNTATASINVTVNNAVFSPCDINKDGVTNVMDVQLEVNAALGVIACAPAYDLNQDGLCNVIDVQRVVNAALGGKCVVGP